MQRLPSAVSLCTGAAAADGDPASSATAASSTRFDNSAARFGGRAGRPELRVLAVEEARGPISHSCKKSAANEASSMRNGRNESRKSLYVCT